MRRRQSGPLPQAAHAGWSLASNSGGTFWIWTLNSGVQQPHTGYYREMIYMENWLWKHHLPLIFTSSSWVKTGPPGIGSIKVHLATRRMSRAPHQHCSVTPKSHRTKNHSGLRRGSVEPSDASAELGCPRRGPRLPDSLEQDLSCLTCCCQSPSTPSRYRKPRGQMKDAPPGPHGELGLWMEPGSASLNFPWLYVTITPFTESWWLV